MYYFCHLDYIIIELIGNIDKLVWKMQLKCHANKQIVNCRITFEKHFEITNPF
jgi:hypothetical protein